MHCPSYGMLQFRGPSLQLRLHLESWVSLAKLSESHFACFYPFKPERIYDSTNKSQVWGINQENVLSAVR